MSAHRVYTTLSTVSGDYKSRKISIFCRFDQFSIYGISRHVDWCALCSKTLTFEIQRGWKSGTTVTFEGEGDEALNVRPGDVQFVITERKHAQFERVGHDLVKTVRITLKQALMGVQVKVSTLDGRTLRVPVTEKTIYPGFSHKVVGEGMPIKHTDGRQCGDLVIKFEVQFPERLSNEQKETISRCLWFVRLCMDCLCFWWCTPFQSMRWTLGDTVLGWRSVPDLVSCDYISFLWSDFISILMIWCLRDMFSLTLCAQSAIWHFFVFGQNDPAHGSDVLRINISNFIERHVASCTWKLVKIQLQVWCII